VIDSFSRTHLLLILGMSVVTYGTKIGGFWLLNRISIGEQGRAGLRALPGAILVSIVGVELLKGGPAEWAASVVVLAVAAKTDSIAASLAGGVVAVVAFRAVV
jgi:uncharacterized membrane protein